MTKLNRTCLTCDTELELVLEPSTWGFRHVLGELDHEPQLEIVTELERLANRMRTAELGISLGGPSLFVLQLLEPISTQLQVVAGLLAGPDPINLLPGVQGVAHPLGVDFLVNRTAIPDDLSELEGDQG